MNRSFRIILPLLIALFFLGFCFEATATAQPVQLPQFELRLGDGDGEPQDLVGFLQLLLILALLTLAPAFIMLMTAFTRIVVVLSFTRHALATQQIPPNQVVIGLALFLTFFVMQPVAAQVNEQAIQPYLEGEITQEEAFALGEEPIREFMFYHTREKDLALFLDIAGLAPPETRADVPLHILVPSFVISELKTAFQMGFMLFVPFLIIDMVVASTLMSMGMFMLPPVIVSMPFKILLFILVDGWHLVVKSLLQSFG
ncbi:MAG: flagellar type III secretion system pore protein FliP [Dethiobacter sp.]|nr:flagellar type III secretion system pore protein FliP [Dethiobacter sp.]